MSSLSTSLFVFACIFGGAFVGMLLRSLLPEHHLTSETKDVVKLGAGLIGTMAALVLGLLVGSAKGAYDTQKGEIIDLAANVMLLDLTLSHFGTEAKPARETLKHDVSAAIERLWSTAMPAGLLAPGASRGGDMLYDQIHNLEPRNDEQRAVRTEAQTICTKLLRTRLLLLAQARSDISMPMLVVMTFWLSAVFASFGLFAPRNATVVATLLIASLSVSGAVFLILEMNRPFSGLIQISNDPLKNAMEQIGKQSSMTARVVHSMRRDDRRAIVPFETSNGFRISDGADEPASAAAQAPALTGPESPKSPCG